MKYTCDRCGETFENEENCVRHERVCRAPHEDPHPCRLIELTVDLSDGTYEWSVLSVTADYVSDEDLIVGEFDEKIILDNADKRLFVLAEYCSDFTQKEQKQKLLRHVLEFEEAELKDIKAVISILEQVRSKLEEK